MPQTTEEFLVSIGVDQASLDKFLRDVEQVKREAAADPIQAKMAIALDERVGEIADDMRRFREEEEAAAEAAKRLAEDEAAAARAADQLQKEMEDAAKATTEAMQKADAAVQELQGGIVAAGIAAAGLTAILARASAEAQGDEQAYAQLGIAFGDLRDKAAAASVEINATTGRAVGYVQQLLAETNLAVQAFGFAGDAALDVSRKLVKAAIDMSAVTGDDAAMILQQFSVGLQLSGRALLKYGINLDAARVKAEALQQGLDPKKLTQYQEAQVKLALILKDTAKFTGAASGSQQTFTESLKDLSDAVGEAFGELGAAVNEILRPFVAAVGGAVVALKNWFKENPRLTKVIAAFGVALTGVLGSIAALGGAVALAAFAYRQYAAVQAVVTGAQIALTTSTSGSTAATVANTAATVANTAAKSTNATATAASAVAQSTVGKAMSILNGIMSITTAQVIANTRAWLSMTLTRVGDWIFNAYNSVVKLASGVTTLTGYLLKGQIGVRAWVNMVGSEFSPALLQTVGSTSALVTALSALAVAFVGFKIGGYIEEWLGLADAQERVQNGTATLADTIKSKLVDGLLVAIGPIGWAGLAWKKYYEYQSQALKSANAEQIKKAVEALDPARQALYNQYLKEGMTDWRALKAAIGDTAGELTRFQFLLGIRKDATPAQLAELEGLYRQLSNTIPGFAARYAEAMGRTVPEANQKMALSMEQAKKVLEDTQKTFDDLKKSFGAAELRLNVGADAAKAYDDLKKLGEAMEVFRQRAAAHQATIDGLNKLRFTTSAGYEGARAQIAEQEKALAEIRRLADIAAREQTRLIEESFAKQAQTARSGYDAQVKAAEDAKNKIIAIERAKVDELQALIDKEQDIRKTANERALSFEKSLDDAALRRKDATLAEIQALRESAQASLENVSDQEARARILAKVTEEIQRLASTEEASKQIADQLAAVRKQEAADMQALADATAALTKARNAQIDADSEQEKVAAAQQVKDATERQADAAERLAATQKSVAELTAKQAQEEQLRAERAAKATAETKALADASAQQAQTAADRDKEILSLQQEKLNRQKAINDEEKKFQSEVLKSKEEYEKKIETLDRFRKKMEEIVELQRQYTRLLATPGAEAQQEARRVGGTLAGAQAGLQMRVEEAQPQLAGEAASFEADVKKSVDELTEQLALTRQDVQASGEAVKTTEAKVEEARVAAEQSAVAVDQVAANVDISLAGLAAAVARIQPASDALVQKVSDVETAIAPVPEAMDSALTAQEGLASSVESLGKTTVEFAAGMKARWDDTTKRLVAIEAEIARLGSSGEAAASGF